MELSRFTGGVFALSLVILYFTVQPAVSKTIDQLIVGAATKVTSFDFLADPSDDYKNMDKMNYTVMHELDMLLTLEQWMGLMGEKTAGSSTSSRQKRKAFRNLRSRWPTNVIPYRIQGGTFSSADMAQINAAIKEWQDNTCLTFRQANDQDSDYVEFVNGGGCQSFIGRTGGRQTLQLARGCRFKGIIAHEIGHAVGFFHEQNRPDRDDYIIINLDNVQSEDLHSNFIKYSPDTIDTFGVPYDYRSVMHYGRSAFSGNDMDTIITRDPAFQDVIGNRDGLSFNDIKLANLMYNCGGNCDASISCPSSGFRGKDCKCYCQGSPVQLCDDDSGSGVTERPGQQTTRSATARPTQRPGCDDMNQLCSAWAAAGHCNRNENVRTFCPNSCMMCPGETRTTQKMCMDMNEFCPLLSGLGSCRGIFRSFMSQNCAESCGLCGNDPTGTSTSRTTNTGSPLSTSRRPISRAGGEDDSNNGVGFVSVSSVLILATALNALSNAM